MGVPKEIYERPRTRFVADFVGINNLLLGAVEERRGDRLVMTTALGRFHAIPNGPIEGTCVLAIRPENIALGASAPADGNVVRGRISFASYLGNTLRYDVETSGGQVLKADVRDHEPLAIGCEVAAAFPASVTLAVAEDV